VHTRGPELACSDVASAITTVLLGLAENTLANLDDIDPEPLPPTGPAPGELPLRVRGREARGNVCVAL
jgi:hypothetical protein